MKPIFFFTLRLAIIVTLAVWFVDRSGPARFVWGGYVVETSAAVIGFGVFVLGFLLYVLLRFWSALKNGPANLRLRGKLSKWEQGHDHLTHALIAVAGGDAAEAGRRAVQARRLLGSTAATQLLQAQAAQLAGDARSARAIFRVLAASPESAVLGYRGLIMEARRERNWQEVESLAKKLHEVKPGTPWLNLIRFELLSRRQDWDAANAALAHAAASRLLESEQAKNHQAAIFAAASQNEARQGRYDKALQAAERAAKQAPGWLPAIINLAQAQMLAGHRRAMLRTAEKNWRAHPHPQLAALVRSGAADTVEACKQVEKLCAADADSTASHLALAEAALAANIWGAARRHLMTLIGRGTATQEAYRMMGRIERCESGDEAAALQWLTKAADAPADPVWLCRSCGGAHKEWQPLCTHCGSFNTLDWQSPGTSRAGGSGPGVRALENDVREERVVGTEY